MQKLLVGVALVGVCLCATAAGAQVNISDPTISAPVPREQEATLTVENRPILILRARVVTRTPADRVAAALQLIDGLVSEGVTGRWQSDRCPAPK